MHWLPAEQDKMFQASSSALIQSSTRLKEYVQDVLNTTHVRWVQRPHTSFSKVGFFPVISTNDHGWSALDWQNSIVVLPDKSPAESHEDMMGWFYNINNGLLSVDKAPASLWEVETLI